MPVGAGFAGDVTPLEAMDRLTSGKGAILVDVRTEGEWESVGVPDLSSIGAEPVFIEWASAPTMQPNPDFAETLAAELTRRGAPPDAALLMLCRSGARSAAAATAMTARGFSNVYNVVGGFEGSSAQGRPGWRAQGLPSKLP